SRKLHERCCVVLGQDTWKMFRLFRRPDGLGRIEADHALSLQIAIETTKGSELPGHRCRFLMLAVQPVKVVPNGFRLHREGIKYTSGRRLLRHKRLELSEVRRIVPNSLVGRMTFQFKERHESSNCVIHAVRSSSARCPVSRRLRSLSLVGVARGGKSPKFVFIGWK